MTEHRINIMDPQQPAVQETSSAEPQTPKIVYASVSERFVALLIDYGLIFMPGQFVILGVGKLLGDEFEMWHFWAVVAAINLMFVLYEAVFSCGNRSTLGKKLVGIGVVRQDLEGPISFGRALVRAVGYYISGALLSCRCAKKKGGKCGWSVFWAVSFCVRLHGYFTVNASAAANWTTKSASAAPANTCAKLPFWKKAIWRATASIPTIWHDWFCYPAIRCSSNAIHKKYWSRKDLESASRIITSKSKRLPKTPPIPRWCTNRKINHFLTQKTRRFIRVFCLCLLTA